MNYEQEIINLKQRIEELEKIVFDTKAEKSGVKKENRVRYCTLFL